MPKLAYTHDIEFYFGSNKALFWDFESRNSGSIPDNPQKDKL